MNQNKEEKKFLKALDKMWIQLVREEFNNACAICGRKDIIHCHHLIPREKKEFRHLVINGIALCPLHHKYSFDISAHRNSFSFILWYLNNYTERYKELLKIYLEI